MINKPKRVLLSLLSASILLVLIVMGIAPVMAASTPLEVTTKDTTAISTTSVMLNGSLVSLGTATTVNVFFEYGTTTNYGNSTPAVVKTSTGIFSAKLNGISPGVTYHYRAKVDGGAAGSAYGEDRVFTTATTPPAITTSLATDVVGNGAKLNGYLGSLGTATSTKVYFEYGETTDYGKSTNKITKTETGSYSITITDLTPDTVYHFRAKAETTYDTSTGGDFSFKTPVAIPPIVNTVSATNITDTSVVLVGNLTALGSATSVTVYFQYGTTTDYGLISKKETITAADFTDPYLYHGGFDTQNKDGSSNITDLRPGTVYHYRAVADGGINGIVYGEDATFKTTGTQPITPPTVDTLNATNITTGSVMLNGDLLLMGTASRVDIHFEYGTTVAYGTSTAAQELSDTGNFSIELEGLLPATTYHFRAKADGGSNGVDVGSDMVFTTAFISPTIETGEATEITTNTATLNGYLTSSGTAESVKVYFEYGTTEEYGITTTSQTLEGSDIVSVNLPGLRPGTVYHFRAKADAGENGTADGYDMTFITLGPAAVSIAPDSVLEITPSEAGTGENINITVTLVNNGGATGTLALVLKINGLIENSQDVTVPAGASQEATFNIVKNTAGNYQVEVNGLTGSFIIKTPTTTQSTTTEIPVTTTPAEKSNSMQVLAIGAGAAIVVGLLVYLLIRRRA